MSITRRDFFKGTALIGTSILLAGRSEAGDPVEGRLPVLQGATSYTRTQINVMAPEDIVISISGGSTSVSKVEKNYSIWRAYRVAVENLEPGKEYDLTISTPEGVVLDTRKFSTLKPETSKVRVAMVSCMRDRQAEHQAPMWKALEDTKPDLIFLLGDNVYVDDETGFVGGITEERIWRRYVETRVTLDFYHWKTLVPALAVWDDHDFGLNNTYGGTPWREYSTQVFRTLYAQDAIMPEVMWGPGIATSYSAYGQRFYLMDNRSFREHPFIGKTHWGTSQEEWLLNGLGNAKSSGWIMNGSQIFSGYRTGWGYETGHPGSLKKMLKKLSAIEAPVLFCSGDVHYSEIMHVEDTYLGYETTEITSSSMHSNAKEPRKGNKRRIASTGEFNFVVADVDVADKGIDLTLRSHGRDGKQFFEVEKSIRRS